MQRLDTGKLLNLTLNRPSPAYQAEAKHAAAAEDPQGDDPGEQDPEVEVVQPVRGTFPNPVQVEEVAELSSKTPSSGGV